MLHDESIFPDASTFNPSRFLNSEGKLRKLERWEDPSIIGFGFGRRFVIASRTSSSSHRRTQTHMTLTTSGSARGCTSRSTPSSSTSRRCSTCSTSRRRKTRMERILCPCPIFAGSSGACTFCYLKNHHRRSLELEQPSCSVQMCHHSQIRSCCCTYNLDAAEGKI